MIILSNACVAYFLESANFIHNERVQETQQKLAGSSTRTIQQALKYQKLHKQPQKSSHSA